MKMPFGKYKEKEIKEIIDEDISYFIWLSKLDNLKDPLKTEIVRLKKLKRTKSAIEEYETDQYEENSVDWIDLHDFGDH